MGILCDGVFLVVCVWNRFAFLERTHACPNFNLEDIFLEVCKMNRKETLKREEQEETPCCSVCFQKEEGNKLKLCSGCKKAKYCSKECQLKGWKEGHKKFCKLMRNPDKGKSPVYDRFEKWKEGNIKNLRKIFRSLLFKKDDEDESNSFNLCDDHITILGINYTPSSIQNPFQIGYSQAIADAFFVEGQFTANAGHQLFKYATSEKFFRTLSQDVHLIRTKTMGEREKFSATRLDNESCAGIVGIIVVEMAPVHGFVKAIPEVLRLDYLEEDTTDGPPYHLLIALLNQGIHMTQTVFLSKNEYFTR